MDTNEDIEMLKKEFKILMDKVKSTLRDLQDYHIYTEDKLEQINQYYNMLASKYTKSPFDDLK